MIYVMAVILSLMAVAWITLTFTIWYVVTNLHYYKKYVKIWGELIERMDANSDKQRDNADNQSGE